MNPSHEGRNIDMIMQTTEVRIYDLIKDIVILKLANRSPTLKMFVEIIYQTHCTFENRRKVFLQNAYEQRLKILDTE